MMRRGLVLVISTLLLAGALASSVGAIVPAGPEPPVSTPGSFSGRVVDAFTGVPVAGVTVRVADPDGALIDGPTATTGADGRFVLRGTDSDEYFLRVNGAAVDYQVGWVGSPRVYVFGRLVSDRRGEVVTWAPSDLGDIGVRPTVFTGRLVDAVTGAPVAGATVRGDDPHPIAPRGPTATSGSDGRFVLRGAVEEEYHVVVVGGAVGYEDGDVGFVPRGTFGWPVVPRGDGVTWYPRDFGDIELDGADTWGFSGVGDAVYGFGILVFTVASQNEWDAPLPGGLSGPKTVQCSESMRAGRTAWLLDRGYPTARILPDEPGLLARISIPDIPTARPYTIQTSCVVDGFVRGACVNVTIGPGQRLVPPGNVLVLAGEQLLNDPCPTTPWIVVDRSLTGFRGLIAGARNPLISLAFAGSVTATTTTPTTRPRGSGAQPPSPTPSAPAADTTPPVVSGASASKTCPGTVTVSAQVTDNVGVQSVWFTYTGPQNGGPVTMNGSAPSYTGKEILGSGTYQITVSARDLAGNVGTGTTSVFCP